MRPARFILKEHDFTTTDNTGIVWHVGIVTDATDDITLAIGDSNEQAKIAETNIIISGLYSIAIHCTNLDTVSGYIILSIYIKYIAGNPSDAIEWENTYGKKLK